MNIAFPVDFYTTSPNVSSCVVIYPNNCTVYEAFFEKKIDFLPGTEVYFSCRVNHDSHVFTGHIMVLNSFYIKEVCVGSPKKFRRICRHVEWCAGIMPEPWIVPPLPEKNVHGIFLLIKKLKPVIQMAVISDPIKMPIFIIKTRLLILKFNHWKH